MITKKVTKKKAAPSKKIVLRKEVIKTSSLPPAKKQIARTKAKAGGTEAAAGSSFPVVGVGASAGGLDAFRELLKHLPADTGMAFVLVQHLDPHHESMLVSLLSGFTVMPVREAKDNMKIEPNAVYVIPPDTSMGILHDRLQLVRRQIQKGRYLPVDWFLRTLAEDRCSSAIGVVLSGTASDGTLGLQAVKAGGGITFAQDETSAEYFGMPGSAIAAGCVDFVLSPTNIAQEIGYIAHHPYVKHERLAEVATESGDQLNKVFLMLRSRTGHDFTFYKHTTIRRRIKRRMLVHKLERLSDYVRLLEQTPTEVDDLFQDMLINVTCFFRDPETYEALQKEVFPSLLDKRPSEVPLRMWVPGCATGEEAYSLAIALVECLGDRAGSIQVQIFATDIDGQAIDRARRGIYPARIIDEVNPGRLNRFFVKVPPGYQVSKTIRDMCVFAEQNVTKDPPFSKLDLVCCRNLLIYLGSVLQKKVLKIFHYALQPAGFLMLGTSETIGSQADLFTLVDKKNKLYRKKTALTRLDYEFSKHATFQADSTSTPTASEVPIPLFDLNRETERVVLAKYGPPGVVINGGLEILHFRGETGPYLNPAPGSASLNLLKMARHELVVELRLAIQEAAKEGRPVRKEAVRVRYNGSEKAVDLQIIPLGGPVAEANCLLVLFEATGPLADTSISSETTVEERNRIHELEQELTTNREYMQSIIEEHEATNEELKAANEEIQSANEELQSTNEELETAKEELQSTNEELATVNEELEGRNLELGSANNDLTNLLGSVNLPILMLGEDLKVRQFTPQAEKLLNLLETDLGRPISQIRPNLEIPDLEKLVGEVIDTMATKSLEIQDRDGHWHNLRLRPYKTLDNRIEGAVITFIDIDEIKNTERMRQTQQRLLESEHRLQAILDNSSTLIYVKDAENRYQFINRLYTKLLGLKHEVIVGKTDHDLFPKAYADRFRANDREVLNADAPREFEEKVPQGDGDHTYLSIKFPLYDADGKSYGVGCVATDITQRWLEEESLKRLATVVRDANDVITVQDFDGNIQTWNPAAETVYGWSEAEALTMNIRDLVPAADRAIIKELTARVRAGKSITPLEVTRITKHGEKIRMRLTISLLVDAKGNPQALATTEQRIE